MDRVAGERVAAKALPSSGTAVISVLLGTSGSGDTSVIAHILFGLGDLTGGNRGAPVNQ